MSEIILSIQHAYQQEEYDLEVSQSLPIGKCIEQVGVYFGWLTPVMLASTHYSVTLAAGQALPLDVTFEQAGIWNGAQLIFHPPGSGPRKQPEPLPPTAPEPPASGYQFIQLD